MRYYLLFFFGLLLHYSTSAQTKPTPPVIIKVIEGVTDKLFTPDTTFSALSPEDETVLAKQPVANWGVPQESGKNMTYYNLVIGTRSYQLVLTKAAEAEFPQALLLRFLNPQSKPEPIARGVLKPKEGKKTE